MNYEKMWNDLKTRMFKLCHGIHPELNLVLKEIKMIEEADPEKKKEREEKAKVIAKKIAAQKPAKKQAPPPPKEEDEEVGMSEDELYDDFEEEKDEIEE